MSRLKAILRDLLLALAIGLVIGRYKALSRRGGRVSVARTAPRVDRIFEMAGLYSIIEKLA